MKKAQILLIPMFFLLINSRSKADSEKAIVAARVVFYKDGGRQHVHQYTFERSPTRQSYLLRLRRANGSVSTAKLSREKFNLEISKLVHMVWNFKYKQRPHSGICVPYAKLSVERQRFTVCRGDPIEVARVSGLLNQLFGEVSQ